MKKRDILSALFVTLAVALSGFAMSLAIGSFLGGFALASVPVAGKTVSTKVLNDNVANLLRPEISQKITRMNPSRTMLDTILSKLSPVKSNGFEYKFYAVENRPFQDTVAAAYTKVGDGSETAAIAVDNIDMWTTTDTILVNGSTGTDGKEVCLYVYDKDVEGEKIKVQAYNNTGSGTMATKQVIPSIAEDAVLTRMATAKNELDAQTQAHIQLPAETVQYCQIFMAQIEEGEYAKSANKEVDYSFIDYSKQMIYDFKATRELSKLFSAKAKINDKLDGSEKYLTGGIVRSITSGLTYGAGGTDRTITHDNLIDWHKSNFAGNAGSSSKMVFGGSGFTANLLKLKTIQDTTADVTIDYVVKHLKADSINVEYGIEVSKIKTNFGTWFYYYHPLLDEAGWDDNAIVLDLAHIEEAVRQPMRKRSIDLIGSGQKLAQAQVIEECSAVIVRYPDVHATIKPKG